MMEDDEDNDVTISLNNKTETSGSGKISILNSKDHAGLASSRATSNRRNNSRDREVNSRRIVMISNSSYSGRNRGSGGGKGNASNSATSQSSNDMRDKYSSTEWLDITSLSEVGGGDANVNALNSNKITNLLANLPEDMRISKLLRQLSSEKDAAEARKICAKLNGAIVEPSNASYIRRSFDILADTMMRIFKDGPLDAMNDVANIFGKMGWVVRNEFPVYRSWIQRMYKQERIREYVMRALEQTLKIDANTLDIRSDYCNRIIEMLKEYLESIEKPVHFIAITNAIQQFAQNYPKQFQPHFADIVDFVIGWHLETDQLVCIKQHCSLILQTFKPFWLSDVRFTRNLLSQFLEDIVGYRDDIQSNAENGISGNRSKDTFAPEICFGSILGATNSILKCIYDSPAILCEHIGIELLADIFRSVLEMIEAVEMSTAHQKHYTPEQLDVIYTYVNEMIIIALDCRKYGVNLPEQMLLNLIELQLNRLDVLVVSSEKVLIILFVVYKLIVELKTKIPITFVQEIFSNKQSSAIHQLKFSKNNKIVKSVIKIYQTVLNLKIVELLQEAYRIILSDLMVAVDILDPVAKNDVEPFYTKTQAECIVAFHLSTISTLATANSSIIVMWMLEPTILELLTERLQSAKYDTFWMRSPETHFAILTLLISHCRNNNNFIASSALLNREMTKVTDVFNKLTLDDLPGAVSVEFIPGAMSFNIPTSSSATGSSESSPTACHYELILKYLNKILEQRSLPEHSTIVLLDWCKNIIQQSAKYASILKNTVEFSQILESINRISTDPNAAIEIQLKTADCIDVLYAYETLSLDIFEIIAETCCIKMCASNVTIRKRYSDLFAKLPLNVSLKQVNQFTGLAKARQRQINSIQHWYSRTPTQQRGGEMRSQYFADFIRAIKICETGSSATADTAEKMPRYHLVENVLKNIFIHSHCANGTTNNSTKSTSKEIDDFCKMATIDIRVLISWAQWEAAQSCVNNKLRTVLGKPQETFLKIESIIKENARILALKDKLTVPSVDTILANQRHARILLGFMEALEKCIYNASEGTAVALPPAEKPARTFFHVNATTCNEWFNRIRTAVDLVALHCMEPEMVIRYTESVLKNLAVAGKTSEPLFEHTLMSHAWALLRNGENDALQGLFVWSKTITNKKFLWVKMAAEQANGHFEAAIAGYKSILNGLDETKFDPHFRDFIIDQLILCLSFAQEWHDLLDVLRAEELRNIPRATIPLLSMNSKQIEHLIEHLDSNDKAVFDMGDWETLDRDPKGIPNDFSYHRLISLTENTVCHMSMSKRTDAKPYDVELEKMCFSIAQSGLQECLRTRSREHLNNLVVLNHICHKIAYRNSTGEPEDTRSLCVDKSFGSIALTRLLCWTEYFDNVTEVGEQLSLDLRLDVCSMTRKEGNLTHCRNQLETFFKKMNFAARIGCANESSLEHICDRLSVTGIDELNDHKSIWNKNTVRSVYETAKWMYSYSDKKEKAIQFVAANTISICENLKNIENQNDLPLIRERITRSLLTLSEWLQPESEKFLALSVDKPLGHLVNSLEDARLRHNNHNYDTAGVKSIMTPIDLAIGKLISHSIQKCPSLSKAWGAYGNWCYRWGRKIVELHAEKDDKAGLRNNDIASIMELVPHATVKDTDQISSVLNQHKVSAEDEEITVSNSEEVSSTEIIESQLRNVEILCDCPTEMLQKIIEIWRLANRNIYSYYESAADAYFKYLQLATQAEDDSPANISNSSASYEGNSNENCSIVTATLRILRLIVKHALGLQEVLEEGLETTPTSPWKVIIPQLFSRLNHHEPYVRKRVSELLCRVARDSPHLIIFPAVVGAAQEQRVDIADLSLITINAVDGDDVDKAKDQKANSALTICFNSLLDTLSKQASEPVKQVQLLVRELKRMTLLWEELWLSSLAQVYSECVKRMTAFEIDFKKLAGDDTESPKGKTKEKFENQRSVLSEKYRLLVRPILFVMERLFEVTAAKAETAHELEFQEKYSAAIEETIGSLKQPLNFDQASLEGWLKFKQLYSVLQQRSQKRSSCTLKMIDISPVLAQMKNTVISMPGVEHHQSRGNRLSNSEDSCIDHDQRRWIYIRSVDNIVQILPTKTKPKKLAFHGSNGRRYTYLFKGLEDLHLDERIMQFLSIANSMMAKTRTANGQNSKYRAKHYSVIPLGSRSGLISWVDGMTPIFALYKKWQQRQVSNPKKEKIVSTNASNATATTTTATTTSPPVILRPSEMYYKKLAPLLAKHNLKTTSNRKEWPLSALKEVLAELAAETPRDLLSKELWCYSTNAAEWRQVIRNYSQSIAVMSVIGYVIGLGDRHLDNVLVDLSTGEILHIDYNVCFEKGKTLRVPEKVPFRMTPNLEEALGVTGIEGTFRLACEHVLKTLKKGRETLLTLLEAFVYDPLVDWAVGEDTIGGGSAATTNNTIVDISSTTTAGNRSRLMGGDGIKTNTVGPTSAYEASDIAFGAASIQARKQMQNEVTRDTLIVQFAEVKPDWIQNRDRFFTQLEQLQAYLLNLQKQRKNLQKLEANRSLLSKQAALITEAESLGSALSSHSLNTLTQRYSVYQRTRNEFNNCKQALLERSSSCNKQMVAYRNCLESIETSKIGEYSLELNELLPAIQSISATHGFDIVKDFLDNSAQMAIYLQSCQISTELDATLMQQITMVQRSLNVLIEYGAVTRYHPACVHMQHRTAKYAEWCQYLSEHQSVQDCRDIVTQFQTSIGKNAINKVPLQQVITFSYQLQANIGDGQFKLQKLFERLSVEVGGSVVDADILTKIVQYNQLYEDARNSIRIFLHENNGQMNDIHGNIFILHCVTTTILCDLNKRLLMMETAAANSGDNLVDLTFNGNWFLDELFAHSSIMCELATTIEAAHREHKIKIVTTDFENALHCLREIQNMHIHLRFCNEQFSMTILPESVHGVIGENQSVLDIIAALSSLQEGLQSIPELLTNLNLHLRRSAMSSSGTMSTSLNSNAETTAQQACADVKVLRQKLDAMKQQFEQSNESSAGQKLFLQFNGLFDKLDEEYQRLVECVQDLKVSGDRRKLDQMKNSLDLAVLIFEPKTRPILNDIFFVKRIETMIEIFTLILQLACSFKGTGICPVYDDERLCRPLRKFLADFVWRNMLGLQSYSVTFILCSLLQWINIDIDDEINLVDVGAQNMASMETLCRKAVDKFVQTIQSDKYSSITLNRATTLCWNLDVAWRKLCTIQNIQNQVKWQNDSLLRSQLLLTAHLWMYEEALAMQPGFAVITPQNRANIVMQLGEATQSLAVLKTTIQKHRDELLVLITAITQRLKWAVGANPNLSELMNGFVTTMTTKRDLMDKACLIAAITLKECSSVLHYEMLRVSTPEALEEDQQFLNLVSRWEKSCMMAQSCSSVVTPVEEALVELLDPEGPIDRTWLNNVASLIDDMTDQVQQDISKIEKEIVASQDELQTCAYGLRSLMTSHHRIASKVLGLLKSVYRIVEEDQKNVLTDHLDRHNCLLETISELYGHVLSKDFTEVLVNTTLQQIGDILQTIKSVFDDLIAIECYLEKDPNTTDIENDKKANVLLTPAIGQIQQQEIGYSRPSSPSRSKGQKAGQTEQKRNAYAVSVWRRIRMKLEGRDPDPTRRYSTAEQVDWMIREAVDPNNLAVLYEGWTPWV